MEDRLAVAERIPAKTNTRRYVILRCIYAAGGNTRIAREEHTDGSKLGTCFANNRHIRKGMRLYARREVRLHVLRIGRCLLPVVTNADVDG